MGSLLLALLVALAVPGDGRAALGRSAPEPEPLLGTPEVRWSFGPLAFEGPPLVLALPEGERVLVHGRDSTSRRALVVLDGASGRVLSRTLFPAQAALAVAAAGELVAVRSAPDRVDLLRLRGARLVAQRSFTRAGELSAPLLDEHELILREGDELVRHDLATGEPSWRVRAAGAFRGDPALRGAHLFAGWQAEDGLLHLAWIERASGQARGDLVLGRPQGAGPASVAVTAHSDGLFVHVDPPLRSTGGADYPWAYVPFDGQRLGAARLHDFWAAPLETAGGWVAPERAGDGTARWLLARAGAGESTGTIELASSAHHAWLAGCHAGAARAGEVLYLGPAAVDERTLQVLWRRERAPDFAPVAVAGGPLVIEGDRLHRLGSGAPAEDPARARAATLAAGEERELGERLALLASKALRGGDAEYARALVAEAEGLGASGRTLGLVQAEVERGTPAGNPIGADGRLEARRRALRVEEDAARAAVTRALAEAARRTRDGAEARALLGELFRRAPAHAEGRVTLAALLPQGVTLGAGDPLAWLELAAAAAKHPLTVVMPAEGSQASPSARRLTEEQTKWRPDASALESERLLLVSAGPAPEAMARTLVTGEFLCDVLEQVFGAARGAGRLELVLYPTRAEYLAHSGTDLGGLESVLGFTAGHFDLGARVSRLYLPEGDVDGERLLDVAAHELTHHWLALRSRFAPLRADAATPGFWVVEGIATWVEELELDLARGAWRPAPARAASLDSVRNAGPVDLLAWRELLGASFETYAKLETRPTCQLALDWQLGVRHPRSPLQLFYAQGAALAHYLYAAEGGRHRALLLEAVEGYYRGAPVEVAARLGLAPEELGARVVAWARATN